MCEVSRAVSRSIASCLPDSQVPDSTCLQIQSFARLNLGMLLFGWLTQMACALRCVPLVQSFGGIAIGMQASQAW